MSRSPYTVSASVRGIGVAVITRTSGHSPLPRSVARCTTPNRCCSSMTTRPSRCEPHVALHQRMRANHEMDAARFDLGQLLPPARRGRRAGQQRDTKTRRLQQARDVQEVLLGKDLGRRHEGHLQPVLHGHERRQQRDDRLAGAHVALQQPVHRLRALQVVDDLLQRLLLAVRQTERQDLPRRFADAVVNADGRRLLLGGGGVPSRQDAGLEQEGFLEDEAALGGRGKAIQILDSLVRRRKMRARGAPRDAPADWRRRRSSSGR